MNDRGRRELGNVYAGICTGILYIYVVNLSGKCQMSSNLINELAVNASCTPNRTAISSGKLV